MSVTGVSGAIHYLYKARPIASLLAVQNVSASFCPFSSRSVSIRYMLQWLTTEPAKITNPEVTVQTQIRHDDSEPQLTVQFKDGSSLRLITTNLKFDEMLKFYQEFAEPRDFAVKLAEQEELARSTGKLKKFTR